MLTQNFIFQITIRFTLNLSGKQKKILRVYKIPEARSTQLYKKLTSQATKNVHYIEKSNSCKIFIFRSPPDSQ